MATYEKKVSDIFHYQTNLMKHFSELVPIIFNESEQSFKKRMKKKDRQSTDAMLLCDIAFTDYFYEELDDWFLSWVVNNYSHKFTKEELAQMASWAQSHLDFYEAIEPQPGKGIEIQSIFTENRFFLKDISTSHSLTKWDIFVARCYPWKDQYFATGTMRVFLPRYRNYILDRLAEEFIKYRTEYGDDDYSHFAKDRWEVFFNIQHEIEEQNTNRKIFTAFGEFDPRDVIFNVRDINAVLNRLKDLKEFEFSEQTEKRDRKNKKQHMPQFQFNWLTSGQEDEINKIRLTNQEGIVTSMAQYDEDGQKTGVELLGNFAVDPYLARLTVHSLELAEYAKSRLPRLFDHHITFKRLIKSQTPKQEEPQPEPQQVDKELREKIEKQLVHDYVTHIIDEKIPMLNNKTPREARKDPDSLPLLIQWLKEFENLESKKKQDGTIYIDVDRLKKELDITL